VYPCTVDLSTYTSDVSMEMLFGDLCSARIFQADKDIHAQLGITDREALSDARSPQNTPSPKRSEPDMTQLAPPRDHIPIASDTGDATRPMETKVVSVIGDTPEKRMKRSRSTRSNTPGSARSRSDARRTRCYNAALGLEGQTWDNILTSVKGYHNQGSEEEL
jgi:DNA cross-link repair 1C protein